MERPYPINEETPRVVCEPVMPYGMARTSRPAISAVRQQLPLGESPELPAEIIMAAAEYAMRAKGTRHMRTQQEVEAYFSSKY